MPPKGEDEEFKRLLIRLAEDQFGEIKEHAKHLARHDVEIAGIKIKVAFVSSTIGALIGSLVTLLIKILTP